MKLSDIKCKGAKPKEKSYKLFDGGGLYLEVLTSGKKLWRLKYHYLGTEKRISFGPYPTVSLAKAREEAKTLLYARPLNGLIRPDGEHLLIEHSPEMLFEHPRYCEKPHLFLEQLAVRFD